MQFRLIDRESNNHGLAFRMIRFLGATQQYSNHDTIYLFNQRLAVQIHSTARPS